MNYSRLCTALAFSLTPSLIGQALTSPFLGRSPQLVASLGTHAYSLDHELFCVCDLSSQ